MMMRVKTKMKKQAKHQNHRQLILLQFVAVFLVASVASDNGAVVFDDGDDDVDLILLAISNLILLLFLNCDMNVYILQTQLETSV